MHNHQTLYRLLLMLSGVGAVFALLAMFTSLLFPLCAVITILCLSLIHISSSPAPVSPWET